MRHQRRILLLAVASLLAFTLACNLPSCGEEAAVATIAVVETATNPPADTSSGEADTSSGETEVQTVVETVVVVATPTLLPTEAPASSDVSVLEVPAPASGDPTVTSLVDLNVRTGPGTNYDIVGALPANSSATIVGRSPDGFWWKITCPANVGNECWTSAGSSYSTASNAGGVAVASVPPAPTHAATSTYTPSATAQATGTYPPETATALYLTGTATYTATPPDGPTATYTYTPSATATEANNVTGTPTSTSTSTATATYTATSTEAAPIAPFDNDSLQNPAVSVFLSITGNRNFSYTEQISYSGGDNDDWVEFEFPNNSNPNQLVFITLDCTYSGNTGNAQGRVTIYEDQQQTSKIVLCNDGETTLTVDNTKVQQARIYFGVTNEGVLLDYTITVVGFR